MESNRSVLSVSLFFCLCVLPGILFAQSREELSAQLRGVLDSHPLGIDGFMLPASNDYASIPQDHVNNPLTRHKVRLGKFLYHETGVGTDTKAFDRQETYSCATCHHAAAGFKAGTPQGIGDGGWGIRKRRLARGLDADAAEGDPRKPDIQPIASPTVLNTAYQSVMLWNGTLGNTGNDVNSAHASVANAGPPPIKANQFGLPGLETQVLAGTRVHRLRFDDNSVLQTNRVYRRLYNKVYPDGQTGFIPEDSEVTPEALGAAKAIAAYERTILANRAPFQRWLRGRNNALSKKELRGGLLFFGKAGCVDCHTGPALSSLPDAPEERMFFNVGFDDFDTSKRRIDGQVPEDVIKGRGTVTQDPFDDYKVKVPTLYNAGSTRVLGHGASFTSVRQVIKYKNAAVPQSSNTDNLADEFVPLGLTAKEIGELTVFVEKALHDPALMRYQPRALPTGNCLIAADVKSAIEQRCW